MDSSFIQELAEQTAVTAQFGPAKTPQNVVAIPDNYKLHDLSPWAERPRRFERVFSTGNVAAFNDYVRAYVETAAPARPDLFVATDTLSVRVAFDKGVPQQPGHGVHRAKLHVQKTPEYKTFIDDLASDTLLQRELLTVLEDWQDIIIPHTSKGQTTVQQALAAVRAADVNQIKRFGSALNDDAHEQTASASIMTRIESQSELPLPVMLQVNIIPFDGAAPLSVHIRLTAQERNGSPEFRARVIAREGVKKAVKEQFLTAVKGALSDVCNIYEGEI